MQERNPTHTHIYIYNQTLRFLLPPVILEVPLPLPVPLDIFSLLLELLDGVKPKLAMPLRIPPDPTLFVLDVVDEIPNPLFSCEGVVCCGGVCCWVGEASPYINLGLLDLPLLLDSMLAELAFAELAVVVRGVLCSAILYNASVKSTYKYCINRSKSKKYIHCLLCFSCLNCTDLKWVKRSPYLIVLISSVFVLLDLLLFLSVDVLVAVDVATGEAFGRTWRKPSDETLLNLFRNVEKAEDWGNNIKIPYKHLNK